VNISANNGEKWKLADGKLFKFLVVIAGIIFGQAVIYGPSLTGQKILLPLDILACPGGYIPQTAETAKIAPHDLVLTDLITQFEPARRFALSEMHQGRFPLWAPYHYGGVPFVWPKYSLFLLLECCARSPVILAWVQLFAALVAGAGMYFFCRQSLQVSFRPAAICAWCYPLTAFFVLWQGYPTGLAVYWLPWIFLAVDKTVRGASQLAVVGLSVVTFLVLTSGHIDLAGQVLLGSGIYAIWCLRNARAGSGFGRKIRKAMVMLMLGWGLGFLLAAPHLLPLLEYAQSGARMAHRNAGVEERPPVGLAALPQVVLPDIYGTSEKGSLFILPRSEPNLLESSVAAYSGVMATLLVAPLAWCNRRYRALNAFWAFLAFFGLSWCLGVPGFVDLLRLPGLNMMSHNRLVFLTSFAVLALTAIGLENFIQGMVVRRWWFWLPAALLAGLCGWCLYRSVFLPEPIATQLGLPIANGTYFGQFRGPEDVGPIQAWFVRRYIVMAMFCGLGFLGWLLLWFPKAGRIPPLPMLAIFLMGDLLWFGHGRSAQCDPALYYPGIPALEQIAESVPGRVIGYGCLPASVAVMQGLSDIRGYDSIDPARMVDLLETTAVPGNAPAYAATQFLVPRGRLSPPGGIWLVPVLDMLDVRYVVFQGVPPPSIQPAFQSNDYWVLVNSNALPRAFVPKSVTTVTNNDDELGYLTSPQFNPAEMAYVESPVDLPPACRGTAEITDELPMRVTVSVNMETPGLVVLGDRWDKGWRAYWNGKPAPILRTNYAIRGVVVPAGTGTLEFVYRPASLILGMWLAGLAAMVLLGWLTATRFQTLEVPSSQVGQ
jgi:hypothetical protein